MKKAFFWIAAAACACILADIAGDYNTWMGYLAGLNATGERTTVFGSGAGGEAHAVDKSTYIGAAAGTFSQNANESVAVGYRAMRGATNCVRCVAIGNEAMQGANGADSCVLIGPLSTPYGGMWYKGWTDINGLVRGTTEAGGMNMLSFGVHWEQVRDVQGLDIGTAFQRYFSSLRVDEDDLSIKVTIRGQTYRVRLDPMP